MKMCNPFLLTAILLLILFAAGTGIAQTPTLKGKQNLQHLFCVNKEPIALFIGFSTYYIKHRNQNNHGSTCQT